MAYGEKRQRQYYKVKYKIYYKSGKCWITTKETLTYSEIGAEQIIRWLHKGLRINILSIDETGRYAGIPIVPSRHVIGDL
jgi:hypothetical protein